MATLYKADGTIQTLSPAQGKTFALAELQTYVGGDIEAVRLRGPGMGQDSVLVVNEEGRNLRLPANFRASVLAGRHIVGDVVHCSAKEIE